METLLPVFAFVLLHWDVILVFVTLALAVVGVIAKHTKNTIDDEIVQAASEIVETIRGAPSQVKAAAAAKSAATVEVVKDAALATHAKPSDIEKAIEVAGGVFDVVDKVAPTVTAPIKQGASIIGILGGLAKAVFKK